MVVEEAAIGGRSAAYAPPHTGGNMARHSRMKLGDAGTDFMCCFARAGRADTGSGDGFFSLWIENRGFAHVKHQVYVLINFNLVIGMDLGNQGGASDRHVEVGG